MDINDVLKTFDRWAPHYDETIHAAEWGFERYDDGLNWICSEIGRRPTPHIVIDLGSGTGNLGAKLHSQLPSIAYVGVDISAEMLSVARRKVPSGTFLRTDFRRIKDWTKGIPLADSHVFVSTYALHHVPDEEKAELVRQAFTLGEPGGVTFLILDYGFRNSRQRELALLEQVNMGNREVAEEISEEHYFDLAVFRSSCRKAGLRVELTTNGVWDWRILVRNGECR